ncbi:MAG: hypothetical protein K0R38_494 [Polyangiaceae bacterium]|nr:hypothetical protein [Polyangiaceae bacterium]
MKRAWSWALLAAAGAALGVGASLLQDRTTVVRASPLFSLREGSRLLADGRLEAGRVVKSGRLAAEVSKRASRALSAIPNELRPSLVVVDVEPRYGATVPPVAQLAYLRTSGSLVVGSAGEAASQAVWLHELAHVRLAGARPKGAIAQRLVDAIEEGIADYFAAALGGDAVVGSGGAQRDLRQPPPASASEWASLALEGVGTHRMGWRLAARLYERDAQGGSLLRDAVACLDGDSGLGAAPETPAGVVDAFLQACPEAGRARLAGILSEWLPLELMTPEIPT